MIVRDIEDLKGTDREGVGGLVETNEARGER